MAGLNEYRKRCTFNVRALAVLIDGGQELREFKESVWETLRKDPLFSRSPQEDLTVEEQRKITFKRLYRLQEYSFAAKGKARAFNDAISSYCVSLSGVIIIHKQVWNT